ncbi:hypothetical protein PYH37_003452 [Sinorhizobium numidicum]|uniref:Transposase n=1 Tax=Sinorhizobium numidicum TaxID=680248 RepID=A0ABY8CTG7_9HYPH|nr:hypothetical protein [Sinorhizobium numidicum]WEX78554.1 hypothetical protein PYH37_003452 [Sinorhizobium numidicum]WEX81951.1 hypothetical protein PYH38_004165 [Sinorhizobium numidicum]
MLRAEWQANSTDRRPFAAPTPDRGIRKLRLEDRMKARAVVALQPTCNNGTAFKNRNRFATAYAAGKTLSTLGTDSARWRC